MSEARIQKAIQEFLQSQGWYTAKLHGNRYTTRGIPDLLTINRSGLAVMIEVKQPGEDPEQTQIQQMTKIYQAGGVAFLAESVDDVRPLIGESRGFLRHLSANQITQLRDKHAMPFAFLVVP
jgi:hypothetical protein